MTDSDMLMEYQLALADLARAQRQMFGVRRVVVASRKMRERSGDQWGKGYLAAIEDIKGALNA